MSEQLIAELSSPVCPARNGICYCDTISPSTSRTIHCRYFVVDTSVLLN